TFNAHKRRRPPSLQNSPVDLALERNNAVLIPAEVPHTKAPHTETTLPTLVQACPGTDETGVGNSLQVPPSTESQSALVTSSGLKHELCSKHESSL
ncbi:hypothetical protein PIB30_113961, partial [Stylosanthes scabra]|nr:hypothetical protein [Stylosanthes scabra]